MSFTDAVRTCLTAKYATFSGRARRSEYWWFGLFEILALVVLSLIGLVIKFPYLGSLAMLAFLAPSLGVSVRRMHDIGKSGWWLLIGLVPFVGGIILLVFTVMDSKPGPNQYGPSPKAPANPGYAGYPA
jgi:uncharacterized membrane protein YhaH (DUF805 family)